MKYKTPTEAFDKLLKKIKNKGKVLSNTMAIYNESFTIAKPMLRNISSVKRKMKTQYAELEWDWYIKGDRDAAEISKTAKIWKSMMIPGTTEVNSNYGWFWNKNNQLNYAIDELKKNPQSRKATIIHYDINEIERYKYDTPCNLAISLYIKNNLLQMTIFARSIDLVFGFCNDQYTFSKLQEYIAKKLNIATGESHYMIVNLHLYERHYSLFNL